MSKLVRIKFLLVLALFLSGTSTLFAQYGVEECIYDCEDAHQDEQDMLEQDYQFEQEYCYDEFLFDPAELLECLDIAEELYALGIQINDIDLSICIYGCQHAQYI